MNTLFYVCLIVIVNIGFEHVPLMQTPWGDMWPPMSIAVGLIFVARDYAQKEFGHFVLIAMLIGGAISYWLASPHVAVASVAAFLISEAIDWAVYTASNKPFQQRILISSIASTPIDSAVFLMMIGHFTWTGLALMTISKLVAALLIFSGFRWKNRLPFLGSSY